MKYHKVPHKTYYAMLSILRYSFEEIGYDYDELTEEEKGLITEDEFLAICNEINKAFDL